MNVPVLGIVENMSVFCCPNCGHESPIFGEDGAKNMAEKLGYDLLAEVPLDMEVRDKTDSGQPLVIAAPDSKPAAVYRALADKVWDKISAPSEMGPVKIVIE